LVVVGQLFHTVVVAAIFGVLLISGAEFLIFDAVLTRASFRVPFYTTYAADNIMYVCLFVCFIPFWQLTNKLTCCDMLNR